MSVSDLIDGLRREFREDMAEGTANPGREAAETVVLLVCGFGFLLRAVIHGTGWLAAYAPDAETGATITMDWGPVANPAVDATAGQAWRISLVVFVVGLALGWFIAPQIDIARAGMVPLVVAYLNWGVLVADPLLVHVLPEGEA